MVIRAFVSSDHFQTLKQSGARERSRSGKDLKTMNQNRMAYLLAQINRSSVRTQMLGQYRQLEQILDSGDTAAFQNSFQEICHQLETADQPRTERIFLKSFQHAEFFEQTDQPHESPQPNPSLFSNNSEGRLRQIQFRQKIRDLPKTALYSQPFMEFAPHLHIIRSKSFRILTLSERGLDAFKGKTITQFR